MLRIILLTAIITAGSLSLSAQNVLKVEAGATLKTTGGAVITLQTAYNNNLFEALAWTWSNTASYSKTIGDHSIKVLAGTEAVKADIIKSINVSVANYDFEDDNR